MSNDIFEIERKFLIKYPELNEADIVSVSEIEQIYLKKTDVRSNSRIRKRVFNDRVEYTATQKIRISDIKRIEDERVISKDEYEILCREADNDLNVINKKRIVIEYKKQIFEIDIFDFWNAVAIIEIELENENDAFEFPPFIDVIAELTCDRRFTNHSMARKIPDIKEYI